MIEKVNLYQHYLKIWKYLFVRGRKTKGSSLFFLHPKLTKVYVQRHSKFFFLVRENIWMKWKHEALSISDLNFRNEINFKCTKKNIFGIQSSRDNSKFLSVKTIHLMNKWLKNCLWDCCPKICVDFIKCLFSVHFFTSMII